MPWRGKLAGSPAPSSRGDELGVLGSALVGVPGVLKQFAPGGHVGTAAKQGPALAFGHAAPDTELDPVVESVREALGTDDAATADQLGPVLRRPLNEQFVRVRFLARGAGGPVSDPHVVPLLLIVTPLGGVVTPGGVSIAIQARPRGSGSCCHVAKR